MRDGKERKAMPTYVSLVKFTAQGVKAINDMPKLMKTTVERVEAIGGKLIAAYVVMGDYDMVSIWQTPSDEAAMTRLLEIGAAGYVRTSTLKAFTWEEFGEILEKLPKGDE
jgi:uncharacterized protein with GYD domain